MIIARPNGKAHPLFTLYSLAVYDWLLSDETRSQAQANEKRFIGSIDVHPQQENISELIEGKIYDFNFKVVWVVLGFLGFVILVSLAYSKIQASRTTLRRIFIDALDIAEGIPNLSPRARASIRTI